MKINRRQSLQSLLGIAATSAFGSAAFQGSAQAQSRAETLRHVRGGAANALDPNAIGATRDVRPLSVCYYDRLVTFGKKAVPGGLMVDMDNVRGELAERVDRSPDGRTLTFHIRSGATWHDGTAVTPADVKWSLDRGVAAKTLAASFFKQASLESTEQFAVVGDRQVEIKLERPDRLTLPMLCTPFAPMYNSTLAKKYATADDPWATAWLKDNVAGGGAYTVESYKTAQQVILRRNDAWKNGEGGALPFFRRVIAQTVPEAASRANLLERGDADIAVDLAAGDIPAIEQRKQLKVTSIDQFNSFQVVVFGTQVAPFDNPKVRKAVAAALPYQAMFQATQFGKGRTLFDANWTEVPEPQFAQSWPLGQNIEKAKSLLAEAGHPNGFPCAFSFPVSITAVAEPMAALIKEALARIGIDVTVQKMPDSQFNTASAERKLQMSTIAFTAYFTTVDYIMRTFFSGATQFNYGGWENKEVTDLAVQARYEIDQAKYDVMARRMIQLAVDELPMALLWQPSQSAVTAKDIEGYTYWYHSQPDYRDLRRV